MNKYEFDQFKRKSWPKAQVRVDYGKIKYEVFR